MKALRGALVIVILVIVAVATLTTSIRGGEGTIGALVVKFQTLIAGFLAIVAAYLTVHQMRASDQRSDERHTEFMKLSLRADELKVERALHPQRADLNKLWMDMRGAKALYAMSGSDKRRAIREIYVTTHDTIKLLRRPHFDEGSRLFDADLNHRVWTLGQRAGEVESAVSFAYSYYEAAEPNEQRDWNYELFLDDGGESRIIEFCDFFIEECPFVISGMERIGVLYSIHP